MIEKEELSDEMLVNAVGGASIKEIINFVNTNMTTVPNDKRKMITEKITVCGIPTALKLAIELLSDDYYEDLQALKTYINK